MADVRVVQVPVSIEIICDACEEEICMTYNEFTDMCGEPCDWNYTEITCPHCGHVDTIKSWEFD